MSDKLFFGDGNAKLKGIHIFSLPAGHTCPGALLCRAFADKHTGRVTDGHKQVFRCYAASQEAAFTSVRVSRWRNWDLLKACKSHAKTVQLILDSLPKKAVMVRIHASGDFFSQAYFNAWMEVAWHRPEIMFYAYTKALNFWTARLDDIPPNVSLVASYGGRYDALIKKHGLKHAVVVGHPEEAAALKLEIDKDDSHAYTVGVDSFALLIHGTQPAKSVAAASIKRMKDEGIEYSYGS